MMKSSMRLCGKVSPEYPRGKHEEVKKAVKPYGKWLRGLDLNQRPSGYEPDKLPGCSTPRYEKFKTSKFFSIKVFKKILAKRRARKL